MNTCSLMTLLLILFFPLPHFASILEATVAANSTHYEESNIRNSGMSARFRWINYESKPGLTVIGNLAGGSPMYGDFIFAYGTRTGGGVYFEAAGGIKYSSIWGLGLAGLVGMGTDLGRGWSLSLPIIYRWGHSIEVTPYFGYKF